MRLCIWAVPVVLATGSMPSIAVKDVSSYINQAELSEDDEDSDDIQSSNITQQRMIDFWNCSPDTENNSETMSVKTSTIDIDINDNTLNTIDRKQFFSSKFARNNKDLKTPKNKFFGDKKRHRLLKRLNRENDIENTTNFSYSFQTYARDVFSRNHRAVSTYNFMPLGKGTHPKK